jgi:hypothetical protein
MFQTFGNVVVTMMASIRTQLCEIAFESIFNPAVLFKDAHLDDTARKCLEVFASYGLGATQIMLANADGAFNYALSFSLFNGSGTFRISAEKLNIYFKNVRSDKDAELVSDCVAKVYENLPLPEISTTSINASAHATFSSIEEMQQYLLRYANPAKQIVAGGTIAFILCQNWPQEIRLAIEHSLVYPSGLFLSWSTSYPGKKPSREALRNLREAFNESVTKLDLTWAKAD